MPVKVGRSHKTLCEITVATRNRDFDWDMNEILISMDVSSRDSTYPFDSTMSDRSECLPDMLLYRENCPPARISLILYLLLVPHQRNNPASAYRLLTKSCKALLKSRGISNHS